METQSTAMLLTEVIMAHPLTETNDRPQAEAQSAAAAEAATQEPPHIHREGLPQTAVHPVDTGFEFLRRHLMEDHKQETVTTASSKASLCVILTVLLRSLLNNKCFMFYSSIGRWRIFT